MHQPPDQLEVASDESDFEDDDAMRASMKTGWGKNNRLANRYNMVLSLKFKRRVLVWPLFAVQTAWLLIRRLYHYLDI